jgi:hypothetical protein
VRIEEKPDPGATVNAVAPSGKPGCVPQVPAGADSREEPRSAAAAAAAGSAPNLVPLSHSAKMA